MDQPQQARRSARRVVVAAIVLAFALSGCAPTSTTGVDGADPAATAGSESTTADQNDGTGDAQTESDGGDDPSQALVRTGPVADYGGPAYGDQGEAEIVSDDGWCKTIAVFWGGSEPVPDGVRFTFEQALVTPGGLTVEGAVCGTRGADRSCLGLTVQANESGIFCSLLVHPTADFADGASITFVGTLECPTAAICDAVVARDVEPGPPIVVNRPEGA